METDTMKYEPIKKAVPNEEKYPVKHYPEQTRYMVNGEQFRYGAIPKEIKQQSKFIQAEYRKQRMKEEEDKANLRRLELLQMFNLGL